MNAASRQALMQKLARIEPPPSREQPMYVYFCDNEFDSYTKSLISMKPTITQTMQSRSVLLKNMFDPEEYVPLTLWISLTNNMW